MRDVLSRFVQTETENLLEIVRKAATSQQAQTISRNYLHASSLLAVDLKKRGTEEKEIT